MQHQFNRITEAPREVPGPAQSWVSAGHRLSTLGACRPPRMETAQAPQTTCSTAQPAMQHKARTSLAFRLSQILRRHSLDHQPPKRLRSRRYQNPLLKPSRDNNVTWSAGTAPVYFAIIKEARSVVDKPYSPPSVYWLSAFAVLQL